MRSPLRALLRAAMGLALALGLATHAPAQDAPAVPSAAPEPLPSGRSVVEKFVAAMGGEAALRRPKNAVLTMLVKAPAQGLDATTVATMARPDLVYTVTEMSGIGRMEQGYDGKVGWANDPIFGPRLLQGAELEAFKHQNADVFAWSNLDDTFTTMETLRKTKHEGRDAWELHLVMKGGTDMTALFDVETGLQVGMTMDVVSPLGKMRVAASLSDYKDFGGIKLATRTVVKTMGIEQLLLLDSVKWDVSELPSFSPPPDLLRAAAAAPTAPTPESPALAPGQPATAPR